MNNIIEEIKNCCPFKTSDSLFQYLKTHLGGYDLIDLLEKLSCLRFFSLTSFLECPKTERSYLRNKFDKGFSFLFPFLLCFKIEEGNKKISYKKLEEVCDNISHYLLITQFDKKGNEKIDYIQNNLTDLFGKFKASPLIILECEDNLITKKYNVSSKNILSELLGIFPKKIFNPKSVKHPISLNDFVGNFSSLISTDSFIINKDYRSYDLCNDLSTEFGSLGEKNFHISNPLSTINLSRKLFIKNNGVLYNLNDDLICGRLNKAIESLFTLPEEKKEWQVNYKEKTESSVKEFFEEHLIGGTYYENNFYKDENGNLCENDGLFIYHKFVLCIEIKGNKFNPDPINDNYEEVKKSYDTVINKAKKQVLRIKEQITNKQSFTIYDSKGKIIHNFDHFNEQNIIGICIYFEDIGTYLADFAKENDKIIHISFYDLLIVFIFLENPLLIMKYLQERSCQIKNKKLYLNDELLFLSLFRDCINLSSFINNQNLYDEQNINAFYLPNTEFGMEIELYFMGNISKPHININNFINRIITSNDYSVIDDNLFIGLFSILCESKENANVLEEKFKEKNHSKLRLPIVLSFFSKTNIHFALMFISRSHNPYQKKQELAYVKKYFKHQKNIDTIYLISVGKDYSNYLKVNRLDDKLKNIDEMSLLSDIKFSIIRNNFF